MYNSKLVFAIPFVSLLVACGGGADGSAQTGSFSLGVSDNPANVEKVMIAFKQVVLKGEQTFSFDVTDTNGDPKQVDLMQFTGAAVEGLISDQEIPVGEYQLCIYMFNNETGFDATSFVTASSTRVGLATNSKGTCGGVGADDADTGRMFFNEKFTIAAGENNFVAEFNLEKGLLSPRGDKKYWTLKPTAVQIINRADVGSIAGTVSDSIKESCRIEVGRGDFADRVYLYPDNSGLVSSADSEIKKMVDFRTDDKVGLTEVAPLAAAAVQAVKNSDENITGYEYEFGFVAAGTYSLGYSCLGNLDDQDNNDMVTRTPPFSLFSEESGVRVESGTPSLRDF